MSAVILIPVLILFFGTSRSQSDVYIPLFYHLRYYFQIFFSNMSVHSAQYWSQTMYTSLIFITTIMLFLDKQHRSLKIAFIVLTIGLCMPFFGSVMNGFSYITNRWIFAYSMLLAYIIVCVFPKLYTLKVYQFVTLFVIMFVYIGIILYVFGVRIPIYLDIIFLLIMFLDWYIQYKKIKESTNIRRFITGNLAGIAQTSIIIKIITWIIEIAF